MKEERGVSSGVRDLFAIASLPCCLGEDFFSTDMRERERDRQTDRQTSEGGFTSNDVLMRLQKLRTLHELRGIFDLVTSFFMWSSSNNSRNPFS